VIRFDAIDDEDAALLKRAAEWPATAQLTQFDDQALNSLTASQGVDFATAWLYQQIVSSPQHAQFEIEMESLLRAPPPDLQSVDATLALVPGAFYREYPETGADGKCLRQTAVALGFRSELIPTLSTGSSEQNAAMICDWLLSCTDNNVIICSLSKGAADVKMALARPDAVKTFRNVVAWINVGGTPAGSPMIAWLMDRPLLMLIYRLLLWCRGKDFEFVRSMDRRSGGPLDCEMSSPTHIKAIHVLGFPLQRHIPLRRTRRWHRRLAVYGPNDGAAILADNCRLPGQILPVWGADHYLSAQWSPERVITALLRYLSRHLNLTAATPEPIAAGSGAL
jgi:hypothetical protein